MNAKQSTTRRYAIPAALVCSGIFAGAALMGNSFASAADTTPTPSASASALAGNPAETPLTGETADKVKAAVENKYPDATIERLENDSDGVYEAHIRKADGTPAVVTLDENFAITGEHAPMGGPGRGPRPNPVTLEAADKIVSALDAKYDGAKLMHIGEVAGAVSNTDTTTDTSATAAATGYRAVIQKSDGSMVEVSLDTDFSITGEQAFQGRPDGPGRGGRGHGGHGH